MAREFFINTAAKSSQSLVASRQVIKPVSSVGFSLAENPTVRLFFVDGQGNFESFSGDGAYAPRFAVGVPGASPDSGTFTLTFEDPDGNVDTTAAMAHDITAADLQTELEGLSSIDAGEITVTGESPIWTIDFDGGTLADTDVKLIGGDGSVLFPESTVRVLVEQHGGGGKNERQIVRLMQKPLILKDAWNPITNGFQANVATATRRFAEYMRGIDRRNATLNIQIDTPGGETFNYTSQQILLRNELVDPSALIEPPPRPLFDELKTQFVQNRREIKALIGTGNDKLEAIETDGELSGQRLVFRHATYLTDMEFELQDNPDTSWPVPFLVLPRDYNATTNDRGWFLKRIERDAIPYIHVQGTDNEFFRLVGDRVAGGLTLQPEQSTIIIDQ